jgi:hypothetical protein
MGGRMRTSRQRVCVLWSQLLRTTSNPFHSNSLLRPNNNNALPMIHPFLLIHSNGTAFYRLAVTRTATSSSSPQVVRTTMTKRTLASMKMTCSSGTGTKKPVSQLRLLEDEENHVQKSGTLKLGGFQSQRGYSVSLCSSSHAISFNNHHLLGTGTFGRVLLVQHEAPASVQLSCLVLEVLQESEII